MELPSNTTIINLSEEEARLFIAFQKYHQVFEILERVDAFSVKGGSVVLHFDNTGKVGSVDVHRHYRTIT